VLELCGIQGMDTPYPSAYNDELTCIINAYARPEFLPLIWEGVQYQSLRPKETWIVQNNPKEAACVPYAFFDRMRQRNDTVVINSGINHGCWFRFLLAALYCRTRYVVFLDDDTLPGHMSFARAISNMVANPGIYGGRGLILESTPSGPKYWNHEVYGWPVGTEGATEVDFVGQMWVVETYWLRELFKYLPDRLFTVDEPAHECGEEMYLSYVGQKIGLKSYTFDHGYPYNSKWSSIQAYEMGNHQAAMHMTGGLNQTDFYLQEFVRDGWRLLRYTDKS
jgi:hypothetical protein